MTKRKKTKKKKKRGRRECYRKTYCDRLLRFFDQEPYEDVEIDHYKSGELVWTDLKRMPNKLPTLRDFAKSIRVNYVTVYRWMDSNSTTYHEEFCNAFTHAQELRKWFLIQNGLQGLYNPLFAKFTAINITDMRDTKEHKVGPTEELVTLLDMLDGETKGQLPDPGEKEEAGQ